MEEKNHDELKNKRVLHHRLDAVGWSLFFIWMGIAFLADVGWGAGLLGVGIITLGIQLTRKSLGLRFEPFWVVVGFLFALGGVWELFQVRFGLFPILCIAVGVAFLFSILVGKRDKDGKLSHFGPDRGQKRCI